MPISLYTITSIYKCILGGIFKVSSFVLFVSDLTVKCNCGGPDNAKQELKDNEK